jgi:hypothetical protein
MVTLRGCGRRRHVDKTGMRGRPYWNFNLDDHGNQDIASVVRLIHSTKTTESSVSGDYSSPVRALRRYDSSSDHCSSNENSNSAEADATKRTSELGAPVVPPALADCVSSDVDVTLVAHSMGCAASIIFMTTCLHRQQRHGLARAVLLAPAGYHAHRAPLFCRSLGPFIDVVMCRVTNAFCLPYGNAQFILGKLIQDVLSLPALRDLFAFVISGLIGGTLEASPSIACFLFCVNSMFAVARSAPCTLSPHTRIRVTQSAKTLVSPETPCCLARLLAFSSSFGEITRRNRFGTLHRHVLEEQFLNMTNSSFHINRVTFLPLPTVLRF